MVETSEATVFVVDDDPAARESMAALVQSHGVSVETFESAEAFLAGAGPARRGCVVTDVRMGGMNGLELQAALGRRGSPLKVIIITGYADVPLAVRAMRAGASTFLQKPCNDQVLWPSIQEALDEESQSRRQSEQVADVRRRRQSLTESEARVLELLVEGKANKVIVEELDLGLRTVEQRRANVFQKMGAGSLAELVRLALLAEHG